MESKKSRKLNLNRETLHPLQASDLDNVNGGISLSLSIRRSGPSWSVTSFSVSIVKADSQGGGNGGQVA